MTTTTKPSAIYKTWNKRIDSGVITYGQLRQFCEAIAGDGGRRTNLTNDERTALYERAEQVWRTGGFALIGNRNVHGRTMPWTVMGNEWLAKNGKRLAVSAQNGMTGFCPDHIIMAAKAGTLTFRWVGIAHAGNRPCPIYRAIPPHPNAWTTYPWNYYAEPWQRSL